MHAGKNYVTLEWGIKDFITHSTADNRSIMFVSILQAPHIPMGQFQRAYKDTVYTGFPSKSRNPELGVSIYFMTNLLFALEGGMILFLKIAYSRHNPESWLGERAVRA